MPQLSTSSDKRAQPLLKSLDSKMLFQQLLVQFDRNSHRLTLQVWQDRGKKKNFKGGVERRKEAELGESAAISKPRTLLRARSANEVAI
ncbi:hypothetical protein SRHO_G00295350 [Serrasalmus rhombeus]